VRAEQLVVATAESARDVVLHLELVAHSHSGAMLGGDRLVLKGAMSAMQLWPTQLHKQSLVSLVLFSFGRSPHGTETSWSRLEGFYCHILIPGGH
jgi:hypothetical protein